MTDTSKTDKLAFRYLLTKLEAARNRDAEDFEPTAEQLEAEEERFREMLREESGGAWNAPSHEATPTPDDGNIASFDAFRDAQAARQAAAGDTRNAANDFAYDDYYQMAASADDGPVGWTLIDLRLRLPDRVMPVFANPGENDSVFVRSEDCAAEWHSLTLGGFDYELAPSASDPAWIGIDGCTHSALQSLANDGQDIDANPH